MTLDELTRTLQEQADAAMATSPDFLRALPARRRRDRRRLLAVAAAPLAVAAVVLLAIVARPGQDQATRPVDPAASPSASPSVGGESGWRAISCEPSRVEDICAPPAVLVYGGQRWQSTAGGRQPVHNPSGTDLRLSMSPAGSRLMVVGALEGGPRSRLAFRIGDGPWRPFPGTWLTAVPLPAHAGDVVVAERGHPGRREVLALETYVPLR